MNSFKLIGVLFIGIATSPAHAGQAEVKACGAGLSPQGQLILRTVAPKLKPGVHARRVFKFTVRDLVKSGKIARSEARAEGRAVVECLKKMKG